MLDSVFCGNKIMYTDVYLYIMLDENEMKIKKTPILTN